MSRKRKQFSLICAILFWASIITGCAGRSQETDFFEQVGSDIRMELEEKDNGHSGPADNFSVLTLPEHWYNFSIYLKRWAPVVIVGSLVLGWVVYDVFKRNREVQKWAFSLLIVRIPVITLLVVYVYSALYRMLN